MIDTDKYEGHTPAPWEYNTDDDGWTLAAIRERDDPDRDEFIALITERYGLHRVGRFGLYPDLKLIADAPLLLAEVKRLRELLKITAQSYLDSVRTEDMLGEVSVKKDYEICKSIGNAIGARIVWESRIDENTGHDTVYEHPYFTYEEEEYYRGEEE